MNTTLTPLVLTYIGGRLRRGEITKLTARGHRNHLLGFAESFAGRPVDQLGPRAVERWLETTVHLSPSTRSLQLSTLRGFARWLVNTDTIVRDFTRMAPRIRRRRLVSRDMTVDHFAAILAVAETPRQRIIVWLMFGLGLRCVEVSRLQVDAFDFASLTVVVCGKGGHERELPLTPEVVRAVRDYFASMVITSGRLVRNEGNRPDAGIGPERVSGIVNKLIAHAGIKGHRFDGRSAHGLRAAAATDLFEACGDLRVVQEFLGHQNIATTSLYLRKAGALKLRAGMDARSYHQAA